MWWLRKPARPLARWGGLLALLPGLGVGACGFQPLYAPDAAGVRISERLAGVAIAPIADPVGQTLRNQLIDRLQAGGAAENPQYDLTVRLTEDRERYGFEADREVTRERLRLTAYYRLVKRGEAQALIDSRARANIGYDVVQSDFALVTARDNARTQAVAMIADDITTQIALTLKDSRKSD